MLARLTTATAAVMSMMVLVAAPATAGGEPPLLDQAQTRSAAAHAAADGANLAFVEGRLSEVAGFSATYTAEMDALQVLVDEANELGNKAAASVEDARAAKDEWQAVADAYAEKEAELAAALQEAADKQVALDAATDARSQAELTFSTTPSTVPGPDMCMPGIGQWDPVMGQWIPAPEVCYPGGPMPNPEFDIAYAAMQAAIEKQAAAGMAYLEAEDAFEALRTELETMDDADPELSWALKDLDSAESWLTDASTQIADISSLRGAASDRGHEVRDRELDVKDLEAFRKDAAWTIDADSDTAAPGDTVRFGFSVTNTSGFGLLDSSVVVTTPSGLTPACDVPENGTVPAGAAVACSLDYTITEADAQRGSVELTVDLTGYLPLGPGNPRARAVLGTEVSVTETFTLSVSASEVVAPAEAVEAVEVADTDAKSDAAAPDAAELAETGVEAGALAATAALLVACGTVMLLVRRRPVA